MMCMLSSKYQISVVRTENGLNALLGAKELRFVDAIKEGLHQSMHEAF